MCPQRRENIFNIIINYYYLFTTPIRTEFTIYIYKFASFRSPISILSVQYEVLNIKLLKNLMRCE